MVWRPDVTVAAIAERDGRFLLVRERAAGRLVFNQPAGHLEDGETLVEAVVRETLEETAWHFAPEALVGIYLWRHPAKRRSFLRVTFCGSLGALDAGRSLDHGIVDTVWLNRQQLLARESQLRSPMVLRCIDDYLGGARFPIEVLNHLAVDHRLVRAATG